MTFTKEYCSNHNKGLGWDQRTDNLTFIYPTCRGMSKVGGSWKENLVMPQFRNEQFSFAISYNQMLFAKQLGYEYFPSMKSFDDFSIKTLIDLEWYQAQNKFIRTLSAREIFTMFGYSHNGDVWAHAYLDGRFKLADFISGVKQLTPTTYFALFFPAREFYKIDTGDVAQDYNAVLARVKSETNVKNITSIIQIFIDDLNALIQRAPKTKKPFTVFRGVKDDLYMSGIKDKQYTLNRFASTSISGMKAVKTFSGSHTLQRILIMPGSTCLCMFGFTAHPGEWEILMPRGSAYIIRETYKNVQPYASDSPYCKGERTLHTWKMKNVVDIILLGMSKKFIGKPKQVPVVVPVAQNTNVQKMQRIIDNMGLEGVKVLNKLGQGGLGAVFKGIDIPTQWNSAIKIQKLGANFNAEKAALRNLSRLKVVPTITNAEVIPWTQNAANLIPKGLAAGNKAAVIVMSQAKGKPLRNFMTGPPISQNLRNKITNAVGQISAKGWLHGNIHRNNIIINNKGNPVIIDFGKAIKGPFKTTNAANKWLKGLGKGFVEKYGKKFYYSNNAKTRSHRSNKNFLNRLK